MLCENITHVSRSVYAVSASPLAGLEYCQESESLFLPTCGDVELKENDISIVHDIVLALLPVLASRLALQLCSQGGADGLASRAGVAAQHRAARAAAEV